MGAPDVILLLLLAFADVCLLLHLHRRRKRRERALRMARCLRAAIQRAVGSPVTVAEHPRSALVLQRAV